MKRFFLGFLTGLLVASGIAYFLWHQQETSQSNQAAELLQYLKQRDASEKIMMEAMNDSSITLVNTMPLVVILSPDDRFYTYDGKNCSTIRTMPLSEIAEFLNDAIKKMDAKNRMVIIKNLPGTNINQTKYVLDAIDKAGFEAGQFAEFPLSEIEKECLKKFQ